MLEASRILDQVDIQIDVQNDAPVPRPPVGIGVMAGVWLKTNDKPNWISRLDVETNEPDGDLWVSVWGEQPPGPSSWGRVKASRLYASRPADGDARAGAFVAFFEHDGLSVELQANLNLGLLVVATFVRFREPGPYADRFTREFFFRAGEAS
jgi:hypothetical protein